MGRAAWGVLLRERKVTGRDASLPAPLRASSFELVALPYFFRVFILVYSSAESSSHSAYRRSISSFFS